MTLAQVVDRGDAQRGRPDDGVPLHVEVDEYADIIEKDGAPHTITQAELDRVSAFFVPPVLQCDRKSADAKIAHILKAAAEDDVEPSGGDGAENAERVAQRVVGMGVVNHHCHVVGGGRRHALLLADPLGMVAQAAQQGDAQAVQIEIGRERALAEFDVAAGGVFQPARLAQAGRIGPLEIVDHDEQMASRRRGLEQLHDRAEQSSLTRFVSTHREQVDRGTRFRQLTDADRDEIVSSTDGTSEARGTPVATRLGETGAVDATVGMSETRSGLKLSFMSSSWIGMIFSWIFSTGKLAG